MDGNLLDPEAADEALAKDWNLPELPEGNSSLPSSSQELAEIFGTSDDEDDLDFPFSLSGGLPGELALPDTDNAKKFGSSLLGNTDSDLFLNTFHDTLSSMASVPVSISQTMKGDDVQDKGGGTDDETIDVLSNEKGVELSDKTITENKLPADEGSEINNTTKLESQQTAPVLRKSARLRKRQLSDEDKKNEGEGKPVEPKVKQEPVSSGVAKAVVKKELPSEKMEEEKQTVPKVEDHILKKDPQSEIKEEDKRYVKNEESEPTEDSSEEMSEEESDEDPDRLWCICRQPHDDRFMICCDQCEEWYHGDCVGISVGQGKRMEREGKEYVCPLCIARLQDAKEEREMNRSARQARREQVREKDIKKKVGPVHRRISTGASHTPKPEGDQYGMSQLFLPDNAPKEKKTDGSASASGKAELLKNKKEEPATASRCVGPGCEKSTTPPSVYCSQECIEKHASVSLKKLSERGGIHSSNPSEFVRGPGGISVVERGTGKLIVGIAAPSEKNLVSWLTEHPSYHVYLHAKAGSKKQKEKEKKKPKTEKKEPESPSSKMPKIPLMDPKSVRANAKKALFQTLWKRCEDVSDLSDMDQEAVEKVANDIEEKLHNLYQDINPKYKNKYRSLLFNLKDTKNPGLFRKVLRGDIETRQLVRMSSEKLASEELSQWRVQTIKKDLEKIVEREEEAIAQGGTVRKKTYKGEVEIESGERIENIETIDTTKEPTNVPAKSHSQTVKPQSDTTKSQLQSKSQSELPTVKTTKPAGSILDLLTDTTSQHDSHVYDHHCAICNGKMKKPPSPDHSSQPSAESDNEIMEETPPPPDAENGVENEEQLIWRGEFTMHGMARFSASAYAVSGPVDYLDEILPPVLEVMGRIAYVQVWDYVDKLKSSTSRDIVVLRFDQAEEDREAYMAMLNYLVGKHRCGVVKSGYHGIKDMYLLPLLRDSPIAPQLLPFDGPGLPFDHPDMLLGVIIRSKHRKHPSISERLSTQFAFQGGGAASSLPPVLPSSSETGIKRHNSASEEMISGVQRVKKTRLQLEIGFGDQTPPILDQTPPIEEKQKSDDDSPYEPGSLDAMSVDVKEREERLMKKIQMSFYGEHQPMETASETSSKVHQNESAKMTAAASSRSGDMGVAAGGGNLDLNVQSSNSSFQSFLSQLSKEKLDELASVVSSISGQPASAGTAAAVAGGGLAANQSPAKAAGIEERRSNVETVNVVPSTVSDGSSGGSQTNKLNAGGVTTDFVATMNQVQNQVSLHQVPGNVGNYSDEQWHQNQQQQQHAAQFYQAAASEQHQQPTTAGTGAAATGGGAGTAQQHHHGYPVQGGSPFGNYPAVQNQGGVIEMPHQDRRASAATTATHYAASQDRQAQQRFRGEPRAHAIHPGHAHSHEPHPSHWDQHQSYRHDYGHGHSHYHDGRGSGGGGFRDGYGGENRMPHPPQHHHRGKPGGWEGHNRGGHRGHQYHGRREHDRYHDNWHRGNHDREQHWR